MLRSIVEHCSSPHRLVFHVVSSNASAMTELRLFAAALTQRRQVPGPALLLYTLGEITAELLSDGVVPLWTLPSLADSSDPFLVRPAHWDRDGKHETAMNHLRFYSA